ncbi:multidrug efflux RND transporter permease subunit [Megasphaera paucivorans]|uniref:Hydrophobe/amphiphile efflux-1 (HAE1) family protein n=1 Tax=Megasphaera paucivorans TaxID=349095 RepID=A0A1G9V6A9_9FIRM|nr:multidrug efflux RND transporter permease subunit [Megasphaera paucivorans]SDM67630.1 hydrophobe/amphiphile efflux-1 (HAE1) family protein [Megasphaera paucivorans]
MAKFFINRPIFAIVVSIIIVLLGIVSAVGLSVAQYPNISPPTISVSTKYQGANAEVINDTVAQVIEEQVNGVDGMESMTSTSTDTGFYTLNVQFETGTNSDMDSVQTQNRVSEVKASLPDSVQTQGISTTKSSDDSALTFTLYSPNNTYDAKFLENYGNLYLLDDIKRIKGVGEVSAFGADYSMRVWLQPEKMAKLGVSTSDVISAIESQNVQAPAGSLGKMPTETKQAFEYTVRVQGRLIDAKEFGNIIIMAKPTGAAVRLKDIAKVEMGSRDYIYDSKQNGHASAGFSIKLNSDANSLDTIGKIKELLKNAKDKFPTDMDYAITIDNTKFIYESILEVCRTFLEALALVVLVVYLFLQSWRATLIPLLAVPVSLIGTFTAFTFLGFTINTLTLFAMVLAIGLVVDDAIVVIEAVERHIKDDHMSPREATVQAMKEVSGPVIAIAFVLASVFLPVAFFGGIMGVLYKQFALTIAISMGLSAFVALSLTPALCALILKPVRESEKQSILKRFFKSFNEYLRMTTIRYGKEIQHLIPKAKLCMLFLVGILAVTGLLYRVVPSSLVPEEDQGYYMVGVTLPEGASLTRTIHAMDHISEMIQKQPGVTQVMTLAGTDLLTGSSKTNTGELFVALTPWSERTSPALQVKSEIQDTLADASSFLEGNVAVFNPPALPGLGSVGGFSLMIEDRNGGTLTDLDKVATQFVEQAKKRKEIGAVSSNFSTSTPSYRFDVDRQKAEILGVSVDDIFSTLQVFLGADEVNDFTRFGRNYKVIVQAESPYRSNTDALRYLFVKSSNGDMIPLNTLVTMKKVLAPAVITRFNGVQAAKISGTQAGGYSSGQAMEALSEVAKETLPDGYTYEWTGQSREEQQSAGRTPIVFGMALLFAFLCLAALYESWSVPFAVLLAIPSGVFGAFLFQYLTGQENSIYMQIGLIMLIGLAAKNAILIVEFAKVRVDQGMKLEQAAIEAAQLRLRPIIMTSLAFIIGCLPLMLASGAGAGARTSMGTAVVGGMLAATAIGIFLIPILFVVVENVVRRYK